MKRENFLTMFNSLIASYKPKTTFETDDYYNQVKYLLDSDIDRLRDKIIENCEYLPKPAELKKLAQEFKLPYAKKEHSEIEFGNCQITDNNGTICGKPVYKSAIDPYRCKIHYEKHLKYLRESDALKSAIEFYETGKYEIPETEENKPLLKTLSRIKESFKESTMF